MGSSFDYGFQSGQDRSMARWKDAQKLKDQQRNTIGALYLNAIQTPLPKTDDPAYGAALQKREGLLRDYVATMGPEQHASFGQHIHGLIFGEPKEAVPVHGGAPEPAQPVAAAPQANQPPQSEHPFAHNPVFAKIQEGLHGLDSHLKAFAHPLPPQPGPDYEALAAAPTPGEAEFAQKQALQAEAEAARLAQVKARAGVTALNTPQKQYLDRWAKQHGGIDFASLSTEQEDAALADFKKTAQNPSPKLQHVAGNWYDFDPVTKKRTFLAKDSDTRTSQTQHFITNTVTGEITSVPVMTVVSKATGKPIAGTEDNPGVVMPEDTSAPVSADAPKTPTALSAVNANIKQGNTSSKKLNKGKPVSSQAPAFGPPGSRVVGHTAGLLDKSDAAQYTKVAEDANNKEEAYQSAKKALEGTPTASSDQELLYSWVRSNVQGAGRMTQTEFRNAAATGSLPSRAQAAWEKLKTGKLPPELEQMFLADIKRASETATQEAKALRARIPVSSQAPQVPQGDGKSLADRLNEAIQ